MMKWLPILLLLLVACAPVEEPVVVTPTAVSIVAERVAATQSPPTATPIPPTPTLLPTAAPFRSDLPVLGEAPAVFSETWLNTDPLTLEELHGKVVLIEFWTFGCINCKRVIPHIRDWYAAYAGDDFEIVSIHYPEFKFEEEIDNVRNAVAEMEITYPVAIDNDGKNWRRWQQRYWPTRYLIDKQGNIRYKHIGEGAYSQTADLIEELLAEQYD